MRRLLALTLALLLSAGAASAETLTYASDFSSGFDGWYARSTGEALLSLTEEGLRITDRNGTWHSPGRAFDLVAGENYQISVEVMQDTLDSGRFTLSVEHAANGQTTYENLTSAYVPRGQWVTMTASYWAGNYETFVLYVEGGNADTPFTIRNFTLTGAARQEAIQPTPQPIHIPETPEEMTAMFNNLTLQTAYKQENQNNPLFTQRFGADPGMLVWNDRLYVYTTNDLVEYDADGKVLENTYARINTINCISSADLVNWTDHGAIPVAGPNGAAKWATNSWAPCAAHKVIDGKDKFFLYFCNGGNGVSVLSADDPAGPWTDPLGHGLITRAVPNCANVLWLFDPAVFVDNDGTGYLFFGGGVPEGKADHPGTIRCVQLGDDMISLACEPQTIDAPYVFEDSGINRIGDTYYYTYCSNFTTAGNTMNITDGAIQYMTSDSPMGPYTWQGEFFANPGRFFGAYGNNHHSIITFKGQHYLAYHARPVEKAMGISGNYRSPQLNQLQVAEDGSLLPVTGTMAGVEQLAPLNPYEKVSARTMFRQGGIQVTGHADTALLAADTGDWLEVKGADFANGSCRFTLRASSVGGGAVRVTTGGLEGEVLCMVTIPAGAEMAEITVDTANVFGVQDVYLTFAGDVTADWWMVTGA
ncbi:MAG: carbohydrate-binding protein [Clostridiales bacterium]|nr:carbohydrate-binding protein [Clostridiales bacterium]